MLELVQLIAAFSLNKFLRSELNLLIQHIIVQDQDGQNNNIKRYWSVSIGLPVRRVGVVIPQSLGQSHDLLAQNFHQVPVLYLRLCNTKPVHQSPHTAHNNWALFKLHNHFNIIFQ